MRLGVMDRRATGDAPFRLKWNLGKRVFSREIGDFVLAGLK
jgi:hypothetical protein